MSTPLKLILLIFVLALNIILFNACETKERVSSSKTPQQNELNITVPSFAMLEIVGSENEVVPSKSDVELAKPEVIDENIIPIQNTNDLVFKGGEAPVSADKMGNGFSILVSSSRLEVGEPITFYVNTKSALIWQLGDGTTNTGKKISHVFQKPGQYKIEAYNADKTQRNRIEILVLCSSEYVLNKIISIQKAAYSDDEKWLLKSIDEFKKLFRPNSMLIELNQASQGKSNRKFATIDSFIDYFLVKTEQNKEKGYMDLSVINGVRQMETAAESSLLSKITLYE
ncbi:MAG: PKD domain-containing protein [Saprospiraceae bacterium]|nr:PKD domain-containing protein [Saprospiraceae bacterium]